MAGKESDMLCQSRVSVMLEMQKKKKDIVWTPESRESYQYQCPTRALPKMAGRCNLAINTMTFHTNNA